MNLICNNFTTSSDAAEAPPVSQSTATVAPLEVVEPSEAAGGERVDPVNHPPHYKSHASGIECIQITEHMNFCLGNAIKYIWRAEEKGRMIEDLKKARWYIDREIKRRESL